MEKHALGKVLLSHLPSSGIIAVGSGTTVNAVIDVFGENLDKNNYKFISGSSQTSEYLANNGLTEIPFSLRQPIALCIDGADQVIQESGVILKGRGGALLREKVLWESADVVYIVMTGDKLTSALTVPLPIEVVPFAAPLFLRIISSSDFSSSFGEFTVELRKHPSGIPFYTDNHNFIFDVHYSQPLHAPHKLHQKLKLIPGVVETGIFAHLSAKITVFYTANGQISQIGV